MHSRDVLLKHLHQRLHVFLHDFIVPISMADKRPHWLLWPLPRVGRSRPMSFTTGRTIGGLGTPPQRRRCSLPSGGSAAVDVLHAKSSLPLDLAGSNSKLRGGRSSLSSGALAQGLGGQCSAISHSSTLGIYSPPALVPVPSPPRPPPTFPLERGVGLCHYGLLIPRGGRRPINSRTTGSEEQLFKEALLKECNA